MSPASLTKSDIINKYKQIEKSLVEVNSFCWFRMVVQMHLPSSKSTTADHQLLDRYEEASKLQSWPFLKRQLNLSQFS